MVEIAELPPEIDLDDWWRRTLFEQLYARRPSERHRSHWVMSSKMNLFLRTIKSPSGTYLWEPSFTADGPDMLLGLPVHIDEEADGATLRPIS